MMDHYVDTYLLPEHQPSICMYAKYSLIDELRQYFETIQPIKVHCRFEA
jgi:hypothetical protein